MASLLRIGKAVIEGEIHFKGDFCWCGVTFDDHEWTYIHPLKFDKGATKVLSEDVKDA